MITVAPVLCARYRAADRFERDALGEMRGDPRVVGGTPEDRMRLQACRYAAAMLQKRGLLPGDLADVDAPCCSPAAASSLPPLSSPPA